MMTFLNVFRSVGGEFEIRRRPGRGGIRFWHPGGELKRSRWRPTCTPAS